ncbi:unnamed protein product [Oikopleura dioica]|uniref:Uncharacterized protein n=1 Tax=Oikopleura dioica TaxID=34765 RepID=E4XUG2_OIKDI|nr:unnamed protein product [Oikopleura dioica]
MLISALETSSTPLPDLARSNRQTTLQTILQTQTALTESKRQFMTASLSKLTLFISSETMIKLSLLTQAIISILLLDMARTIMSLKMVTDFRSAVLTSMFISILTFRYNILVSAFQSWTVTSHITISAILVTLQELSTRRISRKKKPKRLSKLNF